MKTFGYFFIAVGLVLCSCAGPGGGAKVDRFAGDWQGRGLDSQGNAFIFAAKVINQGGGRYRVLILDAIDSQKEPLHVMDGMLRGHAYEYTSDGGLYIGGGTLDGERFEGYYKGPVDGTFTMQRVRDGGN